MSWRAFFWITFHLTNSVCLCVGYKMKTCTQISDFGFRGKINVVNPGDSTKWSSQCRRASWLFPCKHEVKSSPLTAAIPIKMAGLPPYKPPPLILCYIRVKVTTVFQWDFLRLFLIVTFRWLKVDISNDFSAFPKPQPNVRGKRLFVLFKFAIYVFVRVNYQEPKLLAKYLTRTVAPRDVFV